LGDTPLSSEEKAEQIKEALELVLLKVATLEPLIDVAEDQPNVDIRKKAGSKPSPSCGYFILTAAWHAYVNCLERADRCIIRLSPLKRSG